MSGRVREGSGPLFVSALAALTCILWIVFFFQESSIEKERPVRAHLRYNQAECRREYCPLMPTPPPPHSVLCGGSSSTCLKSSGGDQGSREGKMCVYLWLGMWCNADCVEEMKNSDRFNSHQRVQVPA